MRIFTSLVRLLALAVALSVAHPVCATLVTCEAG